MRKPFVAIDHIKALNLFKQGLAGNSCTRAEFKTALKECGILSSDLFIRHLEKHPVITPVGKDEYKFAYDQPVWWRVLDRVYKDYRITLNRYQENKKRRESLAV